MDKVRSEWNQKLISYMILKDEKLRKKYNEQNNSHKLYEHLQKEHDSKELERVHNSLALVSEEVELRGKSASLQPATTGNSFRRISTETDDAFMDGVSNDGASASNMVTRVEQNTEIDESVVITSTEKVSDRIQVNHPTITNRIPELMSQAFSISKVSTQNKFNAQNAQSSTGSLISSTLQRKLLQARETQAQRAAQEKKAQSKPSVQVTEQSAKSLKEARTQNPAVKDQVPKIHQQALFQKQLNTQRAAAQSAALHRAEIQRSLGLDRAPPSGPRIPLGMAPRLMTSSLAHGLNSTLPLKSCPQLGLKMSSPPMINNNAKITESPLQLSKGSEQRPVKKKRRVGERSSAGKGGGSGSGSEMKLQDKERVKENRGERRNLKEGGEILEDEREGETGGRQSRNERTRRDGGGKKRKREHRKDS